MSERKDEERRRAQDREREEGEAPNGEAAGHDAAPRPPLDHGYDYASELDLTKEPDFLYHTQPFYSAEGTTGSGPSAVMEPQSYRRFDAGLRQAVIDRLAAQRDLESDGIQVEVEERRLTLRGTVPDDRSKRLAEEVARIVAGIAEIRNELRTSNGEGQSEGGEQHRPDARPAIPKADGAD